jgi:hypothetical protein
VCLAEWRKLVCGAMIAIMPASLLGQDSARAMLHNNGGTWLNGNPAPNSSAIFPHDLIETRTQNAAKIDADGSSVTIQPGTLVQFEGDEIVLDHGSLQVNTARTMKVRLDCLTVVPLTQDWTRYDVIDVAGKLTVAAYNNDVQIHYQGAAIRQSKHAASLEVTVHRGEQVSRDERCRAASKAAATPPDAAGPILNSPWAIGAGAVAIGVLTCWALCRRSDPISPDVP